MKTIVQCLFSARLYKIYREGSQEIIYQPNSLERWGDRIISSASTLLSIGIYTSPFICMYMYRRGFFAPEEFRPLIQLFGGIGCILALTFILRAVGRANNPKYVEFLHALKKAKDNPSLPFMQNLRKYDFDFQEWPVNYAVARKQPASWLSKNPFTTCANNDLPGYQKVVVQTLAFAATHTFGLRLIYPGTMTIIQTLLWTALMQGRAMLVEQFDGVRAKVATADGNYIDTMFVDNRQHRAGKGKTLVICCEGNSGFYEIGIMTTPIKVGYSALGWNHPGFGGSTGVPFPEQEQNAVDAVVQYAINELDFLPEDIVLFGWSIGGYSAAWAAVNYPVKGLVLDATFDDLLPLAENQMPRSWSLLVKEVVRSYVDLNVAELVTRYQGPVQLVRRTEDEIICLRPGLLSSNRGNDLLTRIIEARHPSKSTEDAGSSQSVLNKHVALLDSQRQSLERSDISEKDRKNLQLINQYMRDYKSTHCTPLPGQVFEAVMLNINSNSD